MSLGLIINQNFKLKPEAYICVCRLCNLIKWSFLLNVPRFQMEDAFIILSELFIFTHSYRTKTNTTHTYIHRNSNYISHLKSRTRFCFSRISLSSPSHSLKFPKIEAESFRQFSCSRH